MINNKSRKGVSPVVATVLLIVIVIVIGLIIFLWFRSLTQEAVTKFEGTNVELVCDDVEFIVDYTSSTTTISISNIGNVPIYNFNVKTVENRATNTQQISDLDSSWPSAGLKQGESFSGSVDLSTAEEVLLVPILLGTSDSGEQKSHICEDRQGKEVI